MGEITARRCIGVALCALFGGAAFAQTSLLDPDSLNVTAAAKPRASVIDFENVEGPQSGAGVALREQYAKSHGVTFGEGASVHVCARVTREVEASLCPYPQAASGARVAAHDVRAGGSAMTMAFSRPVITVSMRINPTGGTPDEAFLAEINGYDAAGARIASNAVRFSWFQDAFTWPTTIALNADGAPMARVTVELRRVAADNQPVRFLIDDLALEYAPEGGRSPVAIALARGGPPPRLVETAIAQAPDQAAMQEELRLYPAAIRVRAAIDWAAVDSMLAAQAALGLSAAAPTVARALDAAELPVLLPGGADPGTLSVVGGADSYHASFDFGGRSYALYGARVLTVIAPSPDAPAPAQNLKLIESSYALTASFSLFGASYTLTRYCRNDNVDEDPDCYDEAALGDLVSSLAVTVGAAGALRP